MARGRKKLPTMQKKKLLQVMIKAKHIKKAAAEIQLIANKYNYDRVPYPEESDSQV